MTKRILHNFTNCKHERIDYLTCRPTWWCESQKRNRWLEV